jgi:uncharacterized membrane protein
MKYMHRIHPVFVHYVFVNVSALFYCGAFIQTT